MNTHKALWNHEVNQAKDVALRLLGADRVKIGWKLHALPSLIFEAIRFRKNLRLTRKNLLFTKRLAFNAVEEMLNGESRAQQMRLIEIRTQDLLDRGVKGFYTQKVRNKQLREVEFLIGHYLELLNSGEATYDKMVRKVYPSREKYLRLLNRLQQAEEEVMQAAIRTTRKGSKKDRVNWFQNVREVTESVREHEADRIFVQG